MLQLLLLIVFSTSVQCDTQAIRIWIDNTNVTVASRYWDSLVTIGSFTFNGSMTHAVAIPTVINGQDECELIYPLDKLPPSVSSDLYNTTEEGKCVDEELLHKMDRVYWLDPRNWQTMLMDEKSPNQFSQAVPHVERVPCDHDHILIRNTSTTFIILPPDPVKMHSLIFGNEWSTVRHLIYSATWKEYSKNEYYMRHFLTKSSVDLGDMFDFSLKWCEDQTGCECRKGRSYYKQICAFVKDDCPRLEDLPCEKPIFLYGFCCKYCVAAVQIVIDESTFVYQKLKSIVKNFIEIQNDEIRSEVDMYMSKVYPDHVQIVLWPKKKYSKDLLDLADELKSLLDKRSNLGISTYWVARAGNPEGTQQSSWSTVKNIFAGLLAVALITCIALVWYSKKSKWFEGAASFCKRLKSTKLDGEDKNMKYGPMTRTEDDKANRNRI